MIIVRGFHYLLFSFSLFLPDFVTCITDELLSTVIHDKCNNFQFNYMLNWLLWAVFRGPHCLCNIVFMRN
jgi:hypothetical protein